MMDKLYFDTDCISTFLWVKEEGILLKLYPGKIVLPKQVLNELSNPSIPHIGHRVHELHSSGDISIEEILINTAEYNLYHKLAISPPKGQMIIGKGEAAVIALAKTYNGVIASNNLKDICKYVNEFNLVHITTGDILAAALEKEYINEKIGNRIWKKMKAKRRVLPNSTFTEYLKINKE